MYNMCFCQKLEPSRFCLDFWRYKRKKNPCHLSTYSIWLILIYNSLFGISINDKTAAIIMI